MSQDDGSSQETAQCQNSTILDHNMGFLNQDPAHIQDITRVDSTTPRPKSIVEDSNVQTSSDSPAHDFSSLLALGSLYDAFSSSEVSTRNDDGDSAKKVNVPIISTQVTRAYSRIFKHNLGYALAVVASN